MLKILMALTVIMIFLSPIARADSITPRIPQGLGVNTHLRNNNQLTAHIRLIKEAGLTWVRQDIFWDHIEKTKGIYDFTEYDAIVSGLYNAGLKVLLILDYGNALYKDGTTPSTDEAQAAFARFSQATVRHFGNKVAAWEIYNEPNSDAFWKPKPDSASYINLATQTTQAIRAELPNAVIFGPALAGPVPIDASRGTFSPRLSFLKNILEAPVSKMWDGITIHPYRADNTAPESVMDQISTVRTMMKDAGIDVTQTPLIISEWGYSSALKNIDEETQAAYAVRSFLVAAIMGIPFSIWYDWQDDGDDNQNREHRFGLIRHRTLIDGVSKNMLVKPAYSALANLSQHLKNYSIDRIEIDNSTTMLVRLINDKKHAAYLAWSQHDKMQTINFPLPAGSWNKQSLDNNTPPMRINLVTPLTISKMPILIIPELIP